MLEVLGARQQELLKLLLRKKSGMTIERLSGKLEITRTAVRQHLVSLENSGLVALGASRPSGGRPEQLYVLSDAGRELFPRQYSWFAELVIESIRQESGAEKLRERLKAMGARIAEKFRRQHPAQLDPKQRVRELSEIMEELGYDTRPSESEGDPLVIEADNCVFHNLAMKDPDICQFDLALLSSFTGSKVDHQECMARGGNVCRFKFTPPD